MKFLICVGFFLFVEMCFAQQTFDKLNVKTLNSNKVTVTSTTDSSKPCPAMTEAQRDAIGSPATGSCVYNTTSLQLNVYNGTIWKAAGGGISDWETGFNYAIGDVVIESNKIYQANTAHTSGVFATDIANWTQLANDVASSTGVLPLANGGTNKNATASAGAVVYSDADSFELTSVGTTGHVLKSNGTSAPSFAAASIKASGQESSQVDAEELDVPNKQLTQIGTNNHLIETGNTNLLENPGFEHSTYSTGWTTTGTTATLSAETSTIIHGKKALKAVSSSQDIAIVQDSTLYQASLSGVQGFVKAWISNTAPSVSMCARAAGVTLTGNNCVTLATDGLWKEYVIPVVLSATSNGISIAATSVTGTTIVDEAFVGVVPNAMPEVAQGQAAGSSYWTGASGTQTRTSTTLGAYATNAAIAAPTILFSSVGDWQTTDADLIKQTINNLPPGRYKATFIVNAQNAAAANPGFAIYDGSTTCTEIAALSGSQTYQLVLSCYFVYNEPQLSRSFEIYGRTNTGQSIINNDSGTGTSRGAIFMLEYYPPASKVYSQPNNQDTDWVDCGLTTADFTGFGTVSNIEDLCKKDGADLLVQMKFTSGTPTATEARVNLKLLGTALTSAGSSIIPSIKLVGQAGRSANAAATYVTLIEPSVTYMTFGNQQATGGTQAKIIATTMANAADTVTIFARIPINGWTKSQITGTFANVVTAPGISKPKTCLYFFGGASATLASPTVCSTGTCVEVYDSCGAATPPAFSSTGTYTGLTFANGTWAASTPVNCQCRTNGAAGVASLCSVYAASGAAAWSSDANGAVTISVQSQEADSAPLNINSYAQIVCTGQAP